MAKKFFFTLIGFSFLLIAWQITTSLFPHLIFVLPSPTSIGKALIEWRGHFFSHSLATAKEILGGFFLACSASFPLAWIMLRFKNSRSLLQPLFITIQSLPMFALAPLMVIWCGWGYIAVVLPTALMIFFPLTLNIYQGLKATPQELLDFFTINGATQMQTFFKLRLPWARPHIFAGLRIAGAIAGMGALAGEWAGAQKGLGILMLESRRNFDLEITFGALFCLTLLSTLLYSLILCSEYLSYNHRHLKIPFPTLSFSKIKRRKKYFAFPLICSLLIFLCTSSCHKSSTLPPLRLLLDWLPNQNHIPLYVALEKGYFKEENIQLSIQKMHESGGVLSYLTSHQADLALYHTPGTLSALSKGAQIKIIASLIPTPLRALIYRKEPHISKPSDLSGKILGYCIGGPDTTFLDFLLKKGGIYPLQKKNVSVDFISALGTHNVDFIYGGYWNTEPHLLGSFAIKTDYFKIESLGVPSYAEIIVIAESTSVCAQKEFVERFQRGLQKAIDFCKENPDEAFALYGKNNPDKRKKTLLWERAAWEETYALFVNRQEIDLDKLALFHQWQIDEKILDRQIELSLLLP